ncbi:MAG: arsenic efflux protein [Clostridia bacterium]|nr:arsenic efflux protein [Clostridia bacterium]MBQ8720093.1 arsenic efflux protein [Clostridia bacterium]
MSETLQHFLEEVLLESLIDTLKLIPFLFLTYLLMEFIEHRASDKVSAFMKRAGALGPLAGGAVGAVPQCGFSAAASNLYAARVISVGTLVAVFLSTSDEMLPILISTGLAPSSIAVIVGYKIAVGVIVGFGIDLVCRLTRRERENIDIDLICENDNCHCERGILYSALHHTLSIGSFVLAVNFVISLVIFLVGEEAIASIMNGYPVVSHLIASLVGLIPNCASSVALTTLYVDGLISVGTMIAGLLTGAGVGIAVLLRVNRRAKDNLFIILALYLAGALFGIFADLFMPLII